MSLNNKISIICLTPVKNEAWILKQFLSAVSLWADHIIIADQLSTDGSQEIAKSFPKVILVENKSDGFNEPARQKLLLNEARKIEGKKLLITLDADEFFYPNVKETSDWQLMINSKPGTIFKFQMQNLKPDLKYYWEADFFPWGYFDDGAELNHSEKIHTSRIPISNNNNVIVLNNIKVVHFQFVNWGRMESKHRWYQCYEVLNYVNKSPIEIYRRYHHMYSISIADLKLFPNSFIEYFEKIKIEFTGCKEDKLNYFDSQFVDFVQKYGETRFAKLDIWGGSFKVKMQMLNLNFTDPRSKLDKFIHLYLRVTQKLFSRRNLLIRAIDKLFSLFY